jgi:hypothetical protein
MRRSSTAGTCLVTILASGIAFAPASGDEPRVTVSPAVVRPGDVAVIRVTGVQPGSVVEGTLAGRPLAFFPSADGVSALAGIDLDIAAGVTGWTIATADGGGGRTRLRGALRIEPREFSVEHLSLPKDLVELDPERARRAAAEAQRMRDLYATATPDRLWRGAFVAPVGAARRTGGFGVRRVINGLPRSPHAGLDYSAERGTPILAANAGRVALTGEFFFPGRLVVIDHGLGLYTSYFHLDRITVAEHDVVGRGAPIGAVGSTGRATGPHLHFAVTLGSARVDPTSLLTLRLPE